MGDERKHTENLLTGQKYKEVKLGDLCIPEYGCGTSGLAKGTHRLIRITDIDQDGNLKNVNKKYTNYNEKSKLSILEQGDLLVAGVGATHGKTVIFQDNEPAIFASYLLKLNFPKDKVDTNYYWLFSKSEYYWSQVRTLAGGSVQPQFNANRIINIRIPLPPIEVQKSIATFLNEKNLYIKQIIEKKQKIIDKLEEQKYSVIVEAIDGNNEFLKESIGSIFQIVNGATPPTNVENYWNGDITWVTPKDIGKLKEATIFSGQNFITIEGYNNCGAGLIPKNSIIISTRAPIGHLAITGAEMCFNQGCRGLIPNNSVLTDYAYWAFLAHKHDFIALGQGTTFSELSSEKLKSVMIPLPDITTQKSIANFLNKKISCLSAAIDKIKESVEKLEELKNSLITEAVTGQLNIEIN